MSKHEIIIYWSNEDQVFVAEKLIEKPRRGDDSIAPKGRNVRAWGNAPGLASLLLSQALKGRDKYVALSGLDE